jgi:DNA invertase Pin-like site-specific DNA recombinase
VKAGLRNARAKGKRLGRPKKIMDASKIAALRAQALGWRKISRELGVGGVSTVFRIAQEALESGSENKL